MSNDFLDDAKDKLMEAHKKGGHEFLCFFAADGSSKCNMFTTVRSLKQLAWYKDRILGFFDDLEKELEG